MSFPPSYCTLTSLLLYFPCIHNVDDHFCFWGRIDSTPFLFNFFPSFFLYSFILNRIQTEDRYLPIPNFVFLFYDFGSP